ncbi:MAG: NAD(P)/FAD-dependent oxidoreductase, partial [Pseudomonadales bacterium]|nr:NAD(P)/FAD-dependent oxidoreductase [Pseudomonadales bacterium]
VSSGYDGQITLVSGECEPPYNRVLLPEVLGGTLDEASLQLTDPSWYAESGIDLHLSTRVTAFDPERGRVFLNSGRSLRFDRLVLATGSIVPMDRIPGVTKHGVSVFRSLADTRNLQSLIGCDGAVTIVGGGLLGLETAQSFLDCGSRVRVLHRRAHLLNRQLDETAAGIVQRHLERLGVRFSLGRQLSAITGTDRVTGVVLDDGSEFAADAVVFATGTCPEDGLARQAGLACDHGVVVDERLETSARGIYAIGECARVCGRSDALVAPVNRQAEVLAVNLCGGDAKYSPLPEVIRLKVRGIDVYCAGASCGAEEDPVLMEDADRGIYRRLNFTGDVLTGAILVGDSAGSRGIRQLIVDATPIADRAAVAFGHVQDGRVLPVLRSAA